MGLFESLIIPIGSAKPPSANTLQRQPDRYANVTQGHGATEDTQGETGRGSERRGEDAAAPLSAGLCVYHAMSMSPVGRDGCSAQEEEEQDCQP